MFERFTDKGRKIIVLAREEAERHQNDYLGTEHLVLAILRESDAIRNNPARRTYTRPGGVDAPCCTLVSRYANAAIIAAKCRNSIE